MGCSSRAPELSPRQIKSPGYYSGSRPAIKVTTIGAVAREELERCDQAVVAGVTSRGLFLQLASNWVLFLSNEVYHGPLTLNLEGNLKALANLRVGAPVECSAGGIYFPLVRLTLPLIQAAPWQASEPTGYALPAAFLQERVLSMLRQAAEDHPGHRLLVLLNEISNHRLALDTPDPIFFLPLYHLLTACREGSPEAVGGALEALLGLGPGLTPSGDDLVAGFLLAVSRWGGRLSAPQQVSAYCQSLLPGAWRLTSHLSASLIACACRGQADERLVRSLDSLVSGSPDLQADLAALSTWGSSSGFDALAGMAIFLSHSQS